MEQSGLSAGLPSPASSRIVSSIHLPQKIRRIQRKIATVEAPTVAPAAWSANQVLG